MLLMAEIRWHFLLFIIVNLGVVTRTQNVKESCVDETSPNKTARFDCREDGKISYVKMRSGTGSCQTTDGTRCFGLSPPLLIAKLNCYWKSSCIIDWPRDRIILPENGGDCVGKKPGFLEVSYKCFRPNAIHVVDKSKTQTKHKKPFKYLIDICANLTDGKSEYELTGSPHLSGIIRSHAVYPWDYNNTPRSCVVNVFWPTDQKLIVSMQNVELGESDTLQIGNYTAEDMVPNKRLGLGAGHQFNTIFNFSVGSDSNGGKGFVVCFKFTDRGDQSDLSVCDEMTIGGDIHFSEATITSTPNFKTLLQTTTKAPTVKETPKPSDRPVTINKKCERKKTEKKKKRCYDRLLKKQGGSKKSRKKKDRKNRRERSKKNSDG